MPATPKATAYRPPPQRYERLHPSPPPLQPPPCCDPANDATANDATALEATARAVNLTAASGSFINDTRTLPAAGWVVWV